MGLESGVIYIEDLVSTNPVGATDNVDEGDDHLRNIKIAVKGSFPNLGSAAVTKTAAQINDLLEKSGGTMTGDLTIDKATPVVNLDSVSGNSVVDLKDNGTARGIVYWDRSVDSVRLIQYDTDGSTIRASIILTETGDVDIDNGTFKIGGVDTTTKIVLNTKVIDIGDWDMDTDSQVSIAHGITLSKLRSIDVLIRNDANAAYNDFPANNTTETSPHLIQVTATNVVITRGDAGHFDNTGYNATGFNRGWITIQYTD